MKLPAKLEAVATAQGEYIGYPTDYYMYGYVRNLTSEPLYSVAVSIEVTIWPYIGPSPQTYLEIVQVTPALTATLPGQINPFSYNLLLGKATASIGSIKGVTASSWAGGDVYYPLTILGSTYQGTTLSGRVRNDSSHPLHHTRVVAAEPTKCGWREAVLAAETLQPGEETSFSISNYFSFCVSDQQIIVGQGASQP